MVRVLDLRVVLVQAEQRGHVSKRLLVPTERVQRRRARECRRLALVVGAVDRLRGVLEAAFKVLEAQPGGRALGVEHRAERRADGRVGRLDGQRRELHGLVEPALKSSGLGALCCLLNLARLFRGVLCWRVVRIETQGLLQVLPRLVKLAAQQVRVTADRKRRAVGRVVTQHVARAPDRLIALTHAKLGAREPELRRVAAAPLGNDREKPARALKVAALVRVARCAVSRDERVD
mmetsp:Transcript_4723/g.14595  ORF Transcript_4723/g.14595 Transcript_4723/m.14595 type:complete len:234 (+) Transcript_4723:1027-1728(+)